MTYQNSQHFQKNLLDTPVNETFSRSKALLVLLSPQALQGPGSAVRAGAQ